MRIPIVIVIVVKVRVFFSESQKWMAIIGISELHESMS